MPRSAVHCSIISIERVTISVNGIRSVQTALRVLEEVAAHDSVGVTQLSRILGAPKSSLQRMLYTLEAAGWVRESGGNVTRWSLTTRMLRLAQKGQEENDLRNIALPTMERLRSTTRETVHLAVQEGDNVVILERLDSPQPVRTHVTLGMAVPLVASANGKAILSTWSTAELEALIGKGLTAYTASTLVDPARLMKQIKQAQARGYATNEEEWREDVAAVAAPIVIVEGDRAQAGISISTPAYRMSPQLQEEYGRLLVEATASIAEELWHRN